MEYAGRVLIIPSRFVRYDNFRFSRPRSDLSCHHVMIACAIGGGSPFKVGCRDIAMPYSCRRSRVAGFVVPVMRQKRPDCAHVLVRQRHCRDVLVAPGQKVLQPRVGFWFAFGHPDHRPGTVNQQRAQIGVTPFADALQRRFASGRMLSRHNAEPGRELPAVLEVSGISNRGHRRARRYRPDTGNPCQFLAGAIVSMPKLDLYFQFVNLAIQLLEVIGQSLDEQPEAARQIVLTVFEDLGYAPGKMSDTLGNDDPVLGQQPRIWLACAVLALTNP